MFDPLDSIFRSLDYPPGRRRKRKIKEEKPKRAKRPKIPKVRKKRERKRRSDEEVMRRFVARQKEYERRMLAERTAPKQ